MVPSSGYLSPPYRGGKRRGMGSDRRRSKMQGSSTNSDVDPGTEHGIDIGRMDTVLEVINLQGQPHQCPMDTEIPGIP
jgi:hypothetical protein